jgi:hypothetical protein
LREGTTIERICALNCILSGSKDLQVEFRRVIKARESILEGLLREEGRGPLEFVVKDKSSGVTMWRLSQDISDDVVRIRDDMLVECMSRLFPETSGTSQIVTRGVSHPSPSVRRWAASVAMRLPTDQRRELVNIVLSNDDAKVVAEGIRLAASIPRLEKRTLELLNSIRNASSELSMHAAKVIAAHH